MLDAWGWCTGKAQGDGMGRGEGGGFRMGSMCIPEIKKKKKINKKIKNKKTKKKKRKKMGITGNIFHSTINR